MSIHGECGPGWVPGYRDNPEFAKDSGLKPVELEVGKPSGPWGGTGDDPTPAQFLMMLLDKAKAVRAAHHAFREEGNQHEMIPVAGEVEILLSI
jgi:hypothetical protein